MDKYDDAPVYAWCADTVGGQVPISIKVDPGLAPYDGLKSSYEKCGLSRPSGSI